MDAGTGSKKIEPHSQTRNLIERLRKWSISVDAVPASDLMDDAANELERLLITIDTYAQYASAAERQMRRLHGREFYD